MRVDSAPGLNAINAIVQVLRYRTWVAAVGMRPRAISDTRRPERPRALCIRDDFLPDLDDACPRPPARYWWYGTRTQRGQSCRTATAECARSLFGRTLTRSLLLMGTPMGARVLMGMPKLRWSSC